MERETKQKQPPDNWFQIYKPDKKISATVGLSQEFRSMENGDVGRRMNQWVNYTRILETQTAFSSEEKAIAADVIYESEALILKATGFTPQEIWSHAIYLRNRNQVTPRINSNGTK